MQGRKIVEGFFEKVFVWFSQVVEGECYAWFDLFFVWVLKVFEFDFFLKLDVYTEGDRQDFQKYVVFWLVEGFRGGKQFQGQDQRGYRRERNFFFFVALVELLDRCFSFVVLVLRCNKIVLKKLIVSIFRKINIRSNFVRAGVLQRLVALMDKVFIYFL